MSFFVEVVSNDSPAAKRPRSSMEGQSSPEIEGKLHCTFNSLKSNQRISETIHIEGYTMQTYVDVAFTRFLQEFVGISQILFSR